MFTNDIPGVLPPKRGNDDYKIKLILETLRLTRLLIEFDKLNHQEEIMRQMNKLVDTGMMRPTSSPFSSPVILVQKKDGHTICV